MPSPFQTMFRMPSRALLLLLALLPFSAAAQLGPDSLRFAVLSDPQYADKATSGSATATTSRCYRGSTVKMDSAIAFYNRQSPAFLLILGDYLDAYTMADSALAMRDLDTMNARLGKFHGDIYQTLGNHDQASLNKSEWLSKSLGKIKQNYYSFNVGPIHFIVLDGNFTSNGKDYGRVEAWTWTDTWLHKPQRDWLIADLDSAGDKPTIVSIHQNLHDLTDYSVRNADSVRKILETHGNVTHVFQGHRHEGAYARINGIHYITFQAMLNCPMAATGTGTANGNNYSLVTIRDTSVIIDGQVRSPDRVASHKGLAKAVWGPTVVKEGLSKRWNPMEMSEGRLRIRAEGAHTLFVRDLSGRLLLTRTGFGVATYSMEDLAARGAMLVFTVRTPLGTFSRKAIRF
jgi:manganese-dependent ADP-ribose/CDP-alcohol diphosphatase